VTAAVDVLAPGLRDPSPRGGLQEALRRRYLLKLLVRKEVKVRDQGSVLGLAWSYIQPATRFFVYFVVIGVVLSMDRRVPNFPIHIFSGLVVVHFFAQTFSSATRSVVKNRALVRKVGLPREMFAIAALIVSAVNLVPGLLVLLLVAVLTGWHVTWHFVPGLLLATGLVATWGFGMGLLFSAFNVYFRDVSRIVRVITSILPWSCPMIYAFEMVRDRFTGEYWWALEIYLANPVAEAVMLMQQAVWVPTLDVATLPARQAAALEMPQYLYERGLILLAVGLLFIVFAQKTFSRLESSFAEQL
jgi:ABC-2 type transport system permease protein